MYITPASPRRQRRNAEHDGEATVDVDAQQAHRLAVGHAGADHHAEGGELQEGKDAANDHRCKDEVDDAPVGVDDQVRVKAKRRAKIERAGEASGAGVGIGLAP